MKLRIPAVALFFVALAAHAQTPALQYVPTVTTFAGGATATTLCAAATDTIGDGCPATQATLNAPIAPDTDAAGNVYFADSSNNVIRRIDAVTNVITIVAGQVGSAATVCASATDAIGDGCVATQATFSAPHAVHFDRAGNMVITDTTNQVIRVVNKSTGIVSLLMGTVGKAARGVPSNTAPSAPKAVVLDNPWNTMFYPNGDMLVINSTGDSVLLATAVNGVIDTNNSKTYDLAGTGAASTTAGAANGDGGLATAATLLTSRGLAVDAAGNVYIGDYGNQRVRKVSSPQANYVTSPALIIAGTINAYAGTGTATSTGDGGPATSAALTMPQGLGFDPAGNLYIQEYSAAHDFIRTVNPATNIINTYAGNGTAAFAGDNGPAIKASFFTDAGIKFNLGNRATVADGSNQRIRTIYNTPFFTGTAVGSTGGTQNSAFVANATVTPSSATTSNAEFSAGTLGGTGCSFATALAANTYCTLPVAFIPAGPGLRSGQLHLVDTAGNSYNQSLLGIGLSPAAAFSGAPITTVAGTGTAGSTGNGAAATSATVSAPRGGAFDSAGNFFFADSGNNSVREIVKASGKIVLVAGTGAAGFSGDGGQATAATLSNPTAAVVDPAGNVYIADSGNHRIRMVSSNTGVISTIAGTGVAAYTGDNGLASAATFNNPTGLALDHASVLYVADTNNHAVRAFSASGGIIVTLAGTGVAGFSGDGGVPQLAQLNAPSAVTVDLGGNIYIADTGNSVVRVLTPITPGIINFQANIATFAGTPAGTANTGDGGAATAAGLLHPSGVGTDAAGDLYIAAGGQVRLVNPAGIITTIAGTGAAGSYSGEGLSALAAVIPANASNLAVDNVGNVYLSGTAANRIFSIAGSTAATLDFGSQTIQTTSSPQSVTLYNSGNRPLTLSAISVPTAFTLSTSGSNACTSSTTIAAGGSCTLTVTFTPPSVANYGSQITITDNALNGGTSTRVIPLAGTGVGHLNPTTTAVSFSPAAPVYGQTVVLTATVTGTPTPTGKVNFVINSKTTVTATLTNGVATYSLVGLTVGADTVVANYLGDSVNAGSTGTASFSVAPAVLTVTANNVSKYPTQANPALTYSITGYVNGDTAAVVTGTPVLTTTATANSPAGSYPITVTQGTLSAANYTFAFVPGTLTVSAASFTLTVAPTSLSIAAGQVGAVTVTVTPTPGYNGTVSLACGTLPANTVCTFNANSLVVDPSGPQSTQLTISSNGRPEIAALHRPGLMLAFGVPLLGLLMAGGHRRRRALRALMAAFLLAAAMQTLSGCAPGSVAASPFSGSVVITGTDKAANLMSQASIALTIH